MPLPTHTQRSITWLTIERDRARPTYEELILCLKSSLHSTYDLLKRPDEAELVLLAHNAPQFVEDTARETAKEVGIRFGDFLPESVFVKIESYSLESIHNHDVQCSIKTTMGEILKVIIENTILTVIAEQEQNPFTLKETIESLDADWDSTSEVLNQADAMRMLLAMW